MVEKVPRKTNIQIHIYSKIGFNVISHNVIQHVCGFGHVDPKFRNIVIYSGRNKLPRLTNKTVPTIFNTFDAYTPICSIGE